VGQDRQPRRWAGSCLPRRRPLRDQARGRGALRCAALRGQELRRRRDRHRAGLINSGFGDAAVRGLGAASTADGPYEEFNRAVGVASRDVYEKGLLSSSPVRPRRSLSASRTRSTPNAPAPGTRSRRRRGRLPSRGPARPRLGLRRGRIVPATGKEVR
jgi:hypothetical protein